MPINVFGSSKDKISTIKIDTSSFVQKPLLRNNYIEVISKKILILKTNIQ